MIDRTILFQFSFHEFLFQLEYRYYSIRNMKIGMILLSNQIGAFNDYNTDRMANELLQWYFMNLYWQKIMKNNKHIKK